MFGLKQQHIDAINRCFDQSPGIERVILYGSRAAGNYKNSSDIDLTIIGNDINYQQLSKIVNEIDDLMLPYKIDLSLKAKITNPDLIAHIEKLGLVFYDRATYLVLSEAPVSYKSSNEGGNNLTEIDK
jgi:predicted nucleotidyltransferase